MENSKEIWKPINGFEGYQVSSLGRVRSCDRVVSNGRGSTRFAKGKILKLSKDKDGYIQLNLWKDGKPTTLKVHRLVARAFPDICGQFREGLQIDHRNCVRDDNRVENLHWVTPSENSLNPITRQHNSNANKGKFGKLNPNSKPIIQYGLQENFISEFSCAAEAERQLGICHQSICNALKGRIKTAGGYQWRYKE